MAKRADELERHWANRRAVDDFARSQGFRDRGIWPDLGEHRPPDSLWFDGERCFLGHVWRVTEDTPESAGAALLEHLRALASAFRAGSTRRALILFVVDERSEVKRWHLATREHMRDAGIVAGGPWAPVQLGDYGFGVGYPVASAVGRWTATHRDPTPLRLPRSLGPRGFGE